MEHNRRDAAGEELAVEKGTPLIRQHHFVLGVRTSTLDSPRGRGARERPCGRGRHMVESAWKKRSLALARPWSRVLGFGDACSVESGATA